MTKQEHEWIKLAATAAGIADGDVFWDSDNDKEWNPLEDDGDAFRLGAYLCIEYGFGYNSNNTVQRVIIDDEIHVLLEDHGWDLCVAIRMAIVLAAARIGKEILCQN